MGRFEPCLCNPFALYVGMSGNLFMFFFGTTRTMKDMMA